MPLHTPARRPSGDVIAQHLGLDHVTGLHPAQTVGKRDPRAGDRSRPGATIGLDHVAIKRDLALAECRQIDDRTQAPPDQALNLDGTAALFAGARLASRSFRSSARQHPILGRDPPAPLALEPGRQSLFEACGHQDVGIAEFHKAGAFGVFDHAAFERNGT